MASPSPSPAPESPQNHIQPSPIMVWVKHNIRAAVTEAALKSYSDHFETITKHLKETAKKNKTVSDLSSRERSVSKLPALLPNETSILTAVFNQDGDDESNTADPITDAPNFSIEGMDREEMVKLGEKLKADGEKLIKSLIKARELYKKNLSEMESAAAEVMESSVCTNMDSDDAAMQQFISKVFN